VYCRVLGCDYDGTGASDGHLAPEVSVALAGARAQGVVTLLVTGRVLDDLRVAEVDLANFDAVVAENGAVVWLPASQRLIQLGEPPPEHFLGELRARGVPLQAGAVVVGTWDHHTGDVLDLIRRMGIDAQLIFNRAAMMLLPSGINKAVGVRRALEELGRSERNMIAFGDAENDHPLFAVAEIAVAARGSVPAVATAADERLTQPGAGGVALYVQHLLSHACVAPTPPRRHVVLGQDAAGRPATLPGSGLNVMISGDPRSGKSWIAGLTTERLIEQGYRLCLIDPEGDHLALGRRPTILLFGHQLALPPPAVVPRILREQLVSVVLSLASLPQSEKLAYADAVLCALEQSRVATGLPHWIVIDEAHYFYHEASPCCRHFESRTGNYVFVTYRPSLVAGAIYATVGAHVVTRTEVEEERYFVTSLLQARGPRDLAATQALGAITSPRAGLLLENPAGPRWQLFTPGERASAHTHHGRKYAYTELPEHQAFRFLYTGERKTVVAHTVAEFCAAVETVSLGSLRHHMLHGDFGRWAKEILGDAELAAGLRKLEHTTLAGAQPNREEIIDHVRDRYHI